MSSIDLRVDSIAAGGDGVGRHEGMVVFVPRAAPGDLLRVSAVKRDRLMRGRLLEVLEPGPDRITPPCEHYSVDRCGGCQLQHVGYDAQLAAKAGIIRDSLGRIGRISVAAPEVEASEQQWRYRRKLTFALRPAGAGWMAGLRRYDAPDDVFAVRDCPITEQQVLDDWRTVLEHSATFPAAAQLRAAVRLLPDGFAFTLEGASAWPRAEQLFAAVPRLMELWWQPEGGPRCLLHSRVGHAEAGASFVQVNPAVAERLRAWVLAIAASQQPRTAVDAYSGTGDLAVALASAGASVTAIEIDRDAAAVCASRLPAGSRAVAQPVERALGSALPSDLVVVNPPRGGLHASVAEALRSRGEATQRLIYISCDAATLARDVRRMERFEVRSLRGFDMFPQTAHVETVCELVPAA